MKKIWIVLLVVSQILLTAMNSFSFEDNSDNMDNCNGMKHGEKKENKFIEELDLTENQKEQIKDHRKNLKEKHEKLKQKIKEKKHFLKNEFDKENMDKQKISDIVSQIKEVECQVIDLKVEKILFLRNLLTHDQLVKFKEIIKKQKKGIKKKYNNNKKTK